MLFDIGFNLYIEDEEITKKLTREKWICEQYTGKDFTRPEFRIIGIIYVVYDIILHYLFAHIVHYSYAFISNGQGYLSPILRSQTSNATSYVP